MKKSKPTSSRCSSIIRRGSYKTQPRGLIAARNIRSIMTGSALQYHKENPDLQPRLTLEKSPPRVAARLLAPRRPTGPAGGAHLNSLIEFRNSGVRPLPPFSKLYLFAEIKDSAGVLQS